jgi:hypothetical protein
MEISLNRNTSALLMHQKRCIMSTGVYRISATRALCTRVQQIRSQHPPALDATPLATGKSHKSHFCNTRSV